nr:hypothetical protein [Candidatus Sigynarchaeota archaeon]
MNQRERFLKIVGHEEPDRLMYFATNLLGNSENEWHQRFEHTIPADQVVIDPCLDISASSYHELAEDFIMKP